MKNWFTSDWHLNEDRFGLFYRPFDNKDQNNSRIFQEFLESGFSNGDTLYHLGDVLYNLEGSGISMLKAIRNCFPDSMFILIEGNYDEGRSEILHKTLFNEIWEGNYVEIAGRNAYLNHYPQNCIDKPLAVTGHIHGLWKVQRNMVNVGVDAWHFKPIDELTLEFCFNAMEKHYDQNVFPYG